MTGKPDEEVVVPAVVTPPEVKELQDRLDAVDEKIEFVLGEVALRRGLTAGTWMGFLYGLALGFTVVTFLKYVLHWM